MITKILFVGEGVTLAHISRPLTLAKALDARRYEVSFACAGQWTSFVENAGFSVHPLPTRPAGDFVHRLARGRRLFPLALLDQYTKAELELLAKISPDVVVGDFRVSLGISADVAKVPYVALVNGYWSPYSLLRFPIPDHPAVDVVGVPVAQAVFPVLRPMLFRWHIRDFNRLRRHYGLAPVSTLAEMYTHGTWTLYLDIPSLAPTSNLPVNHRYVGPVLWEPDIPLPSWWNAIRRQEPIVYVTLGSSGATTAWKPLVEALKELPIIAAVAHAGHALGPLPKNVFAADYLPALKIIPQARLVISNGGSPTAYQALSCGVPVLGLPSNADQYLMMEEVVRHHAGVLIRASRATATKIGNAVANMLADNSYRAAATTLRAEIERSPVEERFAAFVAEVTARG